MLLPLLLACTPDPAPVAPSYDLDPYTTAFTDDGGLPPGLVALTFDDGPAPGTTPRILDILEDHGVRGTFFQVGAIADLYPDLTAEVLARGHVLGTHTYDHPDLTALPIDEALAQIDRGDAAVTAAAGVRPALFRFPQFASTPALIDAVHERGLTVVHANVLSEDWTTDDPDVVFERTLASLDAAGGGVILFHDPLDHTADVLDRLLTAIEDRGYQLVTLRPRPRLADRARPHGLHVGSVLFTPGQAPDRRSWRRAVTELDLFTVPAYARLIRPTPTTYDFTIPDQTADAAPPGTVLRVHNLVWCEQLPDWVTPDLTGAELADLLVDHVQTVVRHYEEGWPGRIVAYDVVNEPLSWTGDTCPWHRIGLEAGEDELAYVRLALESARESAPHARLYLNDFGIEGPGERADRMVALVTRLQDAGVPLDGVGLQSHFTVVEGGLLGPVPSVDALRATMARYTALGLEVSVTEADVAIPDDRVTADALLAQAEGFAALATACRDTDGCTAFVTWGVGDPESWIPDTFPGWGAPLLFDADYEPKPAMHAVRAVFDAP